MHGHTEVNKTNVNSSDSEAELKGVDVVNLQDSESDLSQNVESHTDASTIATSPEAPLKPNDDEEKEIEPEKNANTTKAADSTSPKGDETGRSPATTETGSTGTVGVAVDTESSTDEDVGVDQQPVSS